MVVELAEAAIHSGDVIDGRYRVMEVIGEGGMGTVYLAEHELIKRRVALKILRPDFAHDSKVVKRFMNEARAAGTLGHPNIVESTDMGFIDKVVPYIVFEYLEGALLTDEIARVGVLPVRRAVSITQQIASALGAAHAAGIVHRDLKSDNVFLTDRGGQFDHVKVLDFGISKFLEAGDDRTRRGMVMGTPEFMSPEQITDPDSVDVRSDVYALGATLYEMLAGRRPFTNEDPRTLLHRIVHTDAPPIERADLPRGLHDLLFRMLAKDPDERLQTMADVVAVLDLYATSGDGSDPRRSQRSLPPRAKVEEVREPATLDTPVPVASANTPWPVDTAAMRARPRRPWLSYAAVGLLSAGLVLGGAWLSGGLTLPGIETAGETPAPIIIPAPAAATVPAAPEEVDLTIDSEAPEARVVFRRRLSPTPFSTSVRTSDIVELVEVSAPGHKTVRYWLTIDRPTALRAELPAGSGMVEATEEQILIALGEVTPVAEPQPVAVSEPARPRVARARPVKAAAVPTPRKIGKAAAEPPAMADTPAPVETEEAPLLASDLSSLVADRPAPSPPDRIAPALVAKVVARYRPQVDACREQAGATGAVTVSVTVDPSGVVSRPQVSSTSPALAGCLLKSVGRWRFAKRPGAAPARTSLAF
jgi:serine/threonine protein kinase